MTAPEGRIDVFRLDLRVPPCRLVQLRSWLSSDERERVSKYSVDDLRDRFIAGRGAMREILGRYLRKDPAEVLFGYGPCGKPYLSTLPGKAALSFNFSRSADVAVLAVGDGRRIGVDIERLQADQPLDAIAAAVLAEEECNAVLDADDGQRAELFYRYWTRREAAAKAVGDGLLSPASTPGMTLVDLSVAAGFAAALAYEGGPVDVLLRGPGPIG